MKNYELLYIIPNQYTEDEAKKIQDKIDSLLKKNEAIIGFQEFLGKKKLAYPINKIAHGYYVVTEFELEDGTKLASVNNELRLDKEILRAQIIEKHKITPAEIAKQKKQREEGQMEEGTEREHDRDNRDRNRERREEKPAPKVEKPESKKISIENLDEKLNEILSDDSVV
ncbi:MAG: 30S ribosomal protein S6 [Candidatus Buchananbacteria bacterium]|jgi:small subunit ribosomal protein S6